MATRFFLSDQSAPYTPASLRGSWDDTSNFQTRLLSDARGVGAGESLSRAETDPDPISVLIYRAVSPPIADAQTISGTVQMGTRTQASAAANDMVTHLHIYVTVGDSDTVRGTLLSNYVDPVAVRWTTSSVGRLLNEAPTLTPVAVQPGDRIVAEMGYRALNTNTTSRTGAMFWRASHSTDDIEQGDSGSLNRNHWLEFSHDFGPGNGEPPAPSPARTQIVVIG